MALLLSLLPALAGLAVLLPTARGWGAAYEEEPINYNTAPATDVVAKLQRRIERGEVALKFDPKHGYLESVLQALKIPTASQMLVFSKTSFQGRIISPRHPRALYFNDDAYVGFVHDGDVLEVAACDPQLGPVFYTLDQKQSDRPRFVRRVGECLECHASSMTREEPGFLVRSVYPDSSGHPILPNGTYQTNDASPMRQRWGGWYVSARSGASGYLGNLTFDESDDPDKAPDPRGANVTDLSRLPTHPDTAAYPVPGSDVVALMVHAHQTDLHNRISRANYGVRVALRDEAVMNKALGEPIDHRSDSTDRRVKSACEPLVQGLLFSGEMEFTSKIEGTSDFAAQFPAAGPRDARGRSLRDLDLSRRLFAYPCSYLIYSESFEGLPDVAKEYVYGRLWEVLSGQDQSKEFAHLTPGDRQAILEILRDTKKGLPTYWSSSSAKGTGNAAGREASPLPPRSHASP